MTRETVLTSRVRGVVESRVGIRRISFGFNVIDLGFPLSRGCYVLSFFYHLLTVRLRSERKYYTTTYMVTSLN